MVCDQCHLRDGRVILFEGVNVAKSWLRPTHPYQAGGNAYRANGRYLAHPTRPDAECEEDIIRVERAGEVITPTPEPRAPEPSAEVGETKQIVEDLEKLTRLMLEPSEPIPTSFEEVCFWRGYAAGAFGVHPKDVQPKQLLAAFKMASVKPGFMSPSPPAAIEDAAGETSRCWECQDACLGEGVDMKDGLCGACQQHVEPALPDTVGSSARASSAPADPGGGSSAAPGDAVVKGPGKYRTADFDEYGKPQWIAEVIGQAGPDGKWLGCVGPYACWWNSDGLADRHHRYDITGPSVAPPKPVRQQLREDAEWLECNLSYSSSGQAIAKRLRELADELQPS